MRAQRFNQPRQRSLRVRKRGAKAWRGNANVLAPVHVLKIEYGTFNSSSFEERCQEGDPGGTLEKKEQIYLGFDLSSANN